MSIVSGAARALSAAAAAAIVIGASPALAAQPAPAIMLHGQGVQIYTCTQGPPGFAWHLKAPEADLLDARGKVAGHHAAGPVWIANDGSSVTGEKLTQGAAPTPGAVPWLVLRAKAHAGTGLFANIAYIVRSQTEGGAAPQAGCDAGHANAETRIPYNATYLFFP